MTSFKYTYTYMLITSVKHMQTLMLIFFSFPLFCHTLLFLRNDQHIFI